MDKWILAYTQTLIKFVHEEMTGTFAMRVLTFIDFSAAAYRLYTVVPRLLKFIDSLTNWYVRFNRKRFKACSSLEEVVHSEVPCTGCREQRGGHECGSVDAGGGADVPH